MVQVIASLDEREKAGYEHIWLPLYTTDAATGGEKVLQVKALVYIATPSNTSFLGYETHSTIARHIAHAKGPSGKNIDYLTSLQAALHGISRPDEHVDALVAALSL